MTARWLPFVTTVMVFLSLAASARAGDEELPRLVVTRGAGAADCPNAAELAGLVWSLGQREVTTTSTGPASLVVHVAFERNAAGYTAVLQAWGTQHGTRALSDIGPSCRSLAEALAVVIAIVLDAEPTQEEFALAPRAPPPDTASPSPHERIAAPELQLGVEALGGVTVALLDGPVAVGGGGLTLRLGNRLDLFLGGLGLQRDQVVAEGGEVKLGLAAGTVRGCAAVVRHEAGALHLCAASLVGSLRGTGEGFSVRDDSQGLFYSAVGMGPAGQGVLGAGASWWLTAMTVVPLARHGFRVRDEVRTQEVFKAAPFGLLFTMGLRWETILE